MSSDMASGLVARHISCELGGRKVLDDVSVHIPRGCWTAIAGPNGAGKSTLLRVLAGLQATSGSTAIVQWNGQQITSMGARQRARSMAWLGQNEQASADLRVWDIVMLGRLPHQGWLGGPSPDDERAVQQALQATRTHFWRDRALGALSGGERQRVLLARALATEADLLLMDEPLMHLDPPHQADWIATVRALVAEGRTVVSVLHELNVALMSDHLVLMREGRVTHTGPSDDPASHAALEAVFDGRVQVLALPPSAETVANGPKRVVLPR